MDCLAFCCGSPDSCTRVCRNRPASFVDQVREIGGFDLDDVDRAPVVTCEIEADIVPLVYHGSGRIGALRHQVFALPLPEIVNFREARLRYPDRTALCDAFRIPPDARLILSGVNLDHRIEPWWRLGGCREAIIEGMRQIGIDLQLGNPESILIEESEVRELVMGIYRQANDQ